MFKGVRKTKAGPPAMFFHEEKRNNTLRQGGNRPSAWAAKSLSRAKTGPKVESKDKFLS